MHLSSQCTQAVRIDFVSIEYKPGCDFGDSNGLDPKLDIFIPGGSLIYTSHYSDQNQVTGPMDGVPIDDTVSDNECGNFDVGFTIRDLESTATSFDVAVEMYEKDSNVLNDQCDEYEIFFDDNLSVGTHTFDFTEGSGQIDVGGCMVYNYIIQRRFAGGVTIDENSTICPGDTIFINGTAYHQNNASDNIIIPGTPNACDSTIIVALQFFTDIPLELISQDTLCPEGTQSISTTADYDTYIWSTGDTTREITVASSGRYTVTVTSANGCEQISTFDIQEVETIAPQIMGDSTYCEGSSTNLEVSTTANTITWSTGANQDNIIVDIPGEYGVTVTDNFACTSSDVINVIEVPIPVIELDNALEICQGDSLMLSTTLPFIEYRWSSGNTSDTDTITEGDEYSLIVTDDAGCTNSLSFSVTEFDRPIPVFDTAPLLCNDNPVTLSLTESFATYLWSDNSTESTLMITEVGDYSVTVTSSNGCVASQSINVDENVQLIAEIEGNTEICDGDVAVLEENTPGVSHIWNDGSTNNTLETNLSGTYSVTITDINGCTATNSIEVNLSLIHISEPTRPY